MATSMNDNALLYHQVLGYSKSIGPYQALTLPWWVKTPEKTYPPRHRCQIEAINCGEAVFGRIVEDIRAARHSVDIITWGFDPGMALIRDACGRGIRYGELLAEVAGRQKHPVTVRLLLWHADFYSQLKMKNIPGLYGTRMPGIGNLMTAYYSETHEQFNAEWFDQVASGAIPNIHIRVRDVPSQLFDASMKGEGAPANAASALAQVYASHHQKGLLIDYENPNSAIGYVMGHNSVTDYWDSADHPFCSPRRESFFRADPSAAQEIGMIDKLIAQARAYAMGEVGRLQEMRRQAEVNFHLRHGFTAKPYQDVSTRMRGPILYDLNHNFCQGWQEANPPRGAVMDITAPIRTLLKNTPPGMVAAAVERMLARSDGEAFIAARKALKPDHFRVGDGKHSMQLLRTQPMHGEKTAKECYANLTRQLRHYMFIQNQYVQYPMWAHHFNECVSRLRAKGYTRPLCLFILTSTPEIANMDLLTYDVVKQLGQSHTMEYEHRDALEEAKKGKQPPPLTPEEFSAGGVHVFVGSLWTGAKSPKGPDDYEEIYIHSKVAIVDDAAFTVGSANLNIRSMAFDSELNVLSDAHDVAYSLRNELFLHATGDPGPGKYADMTKTLLQWTHMGRKNLMNKTMGRALEGQLVSFYVDREPGTSIV